MARLILMRHAKSDWDNQLTDHARPLNPRGQRDAPRIARALKNEAWAPTHVVSSDAARTQQTWALMRPVLGGPDAVFFRSLYLAGLRELAPVLAPLPAEATVLALGHDPGWSDALQWLCGDERPLKTAHAALLTTSHLWTEALAAPGRFVRLGRLEPRRLADLEGVSE